ncbi:MAG: hypothetical protein AB1563_00055 [Bacillota bacterium]
MISNRVVYLVEVKSAGEPPFEMLAVGVEIDGGYVTFNDTIRQRCFEGRVEKETPDGFVWRRQFKSLEGYDVDETFVFRVLTVKEYDRRVRPKVEGHPKFASDAELHEYYRRQFLGEPAIS